MVYNYEYSAYNSRHKVLVNLQDSNMDALKKQNYGLCWPTRPHNQICEVWKNIQQTVYCAVFKLLPKPLKLLLSQLSKFCQTILSSIIVNALNDLRYFGKHVWPKVSR